MQTTEPKKYVAYYRLSTPKQALSGLSFEAQKKDVQDFVKNQVIISSFTEIESGRKNDRPEIIRALAECKKSKATLIVATFDRLTRDMSFLLALMDSGVPFVCCDTPELNEFTLHIYCAVAQREAKNISEKTKKALAIKKAQGFKLGSPQNLTKEAQSNGVKSRKKIAFENYNNKRAGFLAVELYKSDPNFSKIAMRLNEIGFKTSRGKEFHPMSVKRLYERYK